jgi:hypothetical protein
MESMKGNQHVAVLTSWKEIAGYMGKGVRTVQRWEQQFGLPVRRPLGSDRKAVLARPRDLDAWVATRCGTRIVDTNTRAEIENLHARLRLQIETAQNLCRQSRLHRSELRAAIAELRQEISAMHSSPHLDPAFTSDGVPCFASPEMPVIDPAA